MAVGLQTQRADAAIRHKNIDAISIFTPLYAPAPILPPRTGFMHFAGIKHHKVTFVQDDAFLVDARR